MAGRSIASIALPSIILPPGHLDRHHSFLSKSYVNLLFKYWGRLYASAGFFINLFKTPPNRARALSSSTLLEIAIRQIVVRRSMKSITPGRVRNGIILRGNSPKRRLVALPSVKNRSPFR